MLRASNVPGRIWVQFRIEDDYMEKEIDLRRLVIKAFHITEVEEGGENKVTASGKMTIEKKINFTEISTAFQIRCTDYKTGRT